MNRLQQTLRETLTTESQRRIFLYTCLTAVPMIATGIYAIVAMHRSFLMGFQRAFVSNAIGIAAFFFVIGPLLFFVLFIWAEWLRLRMKAEGRFRRYDEHIKLGGKPLLWSQWILTSTSGFVALYIVYHARHKLLESAMFILVVVAYGVFIRLWIAYKKEHDLKPSSGGSGPQPTPVP
jgi:hypothetical protein